ncbi:MAG: LLM class flavin-dependent oxidoreductase [Acidimicrobiia bacterium]|nr:LLM class flavin-dependent oxidoreductase [Acidimicrobiia bacterium]
METPGRGHGKPVKVGLFLTNQHPIGSDVVAGQRDQIEMFRFARDAGWDSVFAGQHYLTEGMAMPQPIPFLSRIAAESEDMAVGLGIMLLTLYNPVDAAEQVASLDITTDGRFIFGVGLGYREAENNAFGVANNQRVRRFTKNLDIVTRLLAGESVTADLPWCRLDDAKLTAPPVQQPRPPIWIAADADKAVRRAARLADTWMINPHATVDTIVRQLAMFREERASEGLPPASEIPLMREVFCAPTRAEAANLALPYLEKKYQVYSSWGQDKALPGDESFVIPIEALEKDRFVVGTPDDCIAQLLPWRTTAGVDHFIFRTHWSGMPAEVALASMKLLNDEVLPVVLAASGPPPP